MRARLGSDWPVCVVVDAASVVLGQVHADALGSDPDATVDGLMQLGPKTYRLDAKPAEIAEFLREQERNFALVTTSDGQLVGLVWRDDAEWVAGGAGSMPIETGTS